MSGYAPPSPPQRASALRPEPSAGTLHYVLGRSLAGSKPFQTEADCEDFLQRVAALCTEGALADERILGGGAFVERLLADVAERTKQTLRCSG